MLEWWCAFVSTSLLVSAVCLSACLQLHQVETEAKHDVKARAGRRSLMLEQVGVAGPPSLACCAAAHCCCLFCCLMHSLMTVSRVCFCLVTKHFSLLLLVPVTCLVTLC